MNLLNTYKKYVEKSFHHGNKAMKSIAAFFSLSLLLLISACSEDLDVTPGINEVGNGNLRINLAVPEPIRVSTRAGADTDVNSLHIFLFNEDGSSRLQDKYFESVSGNSVNLALTGEAREKRIIVCAVANYEIDPSEITNLEGLKKLAITKEISLEEGIIMFGSQAVDTSTTSSASVAVRRITAKISATSMLQNVSVLEFQVYNFSNEAYLGTYENEEPFKFKSDTSVEPLKSENSSLYPVGYIYPSKGESELGEADGTFLVLKVKKSDKEKEHYYRIDPRVREDDVLKTVDFLANHHYQFEVTDILSDGYDSYVEAAKHPESDYFLVYTIHDHAEEVLSMITDGVHEFGITPEVNLSSTEMGKTIVVKCYDASNPDAPIDRESITFPDNERSSWLKVEIVGQHNYEGDYNQSWETDSPGSQFEFKIYTDNAPYEDTYDGLVTFCWQGLKREVKVTYEAAYLLPTVCEAKLTIIDNDGTNKGEEISDYWTFIQGQGQGAVNGQVPKLWGIQPQDLTNARKRINGFHFPMPYGENNPWTYVYEIDFSLLASLPETPSEITNVSYQVSIPNGEFWSPENIQWEYNGNGKGKLSFTGDKKSYSYAGGTITFTVHFKDTDQTSDIVASLYHTGFFHKEDDPKYVPEGDEGYYYYEVVQMGNDDDYWLDRNIGAKSNKSFIDYEQQMPPEERGPAGRLYTIIKQPRKYQLPEWDTAMCPPGYHIPNSTEWDNLRLHKNFITESVIYDNTVYMSTYYRSTNAKVGNVYFQKARFRNDDDIYQKELKYDIEPNVGDAGAGYYWSVTEAPAMEKEQMGNWLRALYLNGSASSYVNASITDHRMPIRCKAGLQSQATEAHDYYISFNVHNVTHVYLFDPSSKTALYNFPGRAVGSSKSAIKWQNFYCSTTTDPSTLRVLFVKIEEDGRVLVHTKNGDKFISTVKYTENFLTEDYSWEIKNGQYYDFCDAALEREGDILLDAQPKDCDTTSEEENQGGNGGDQDVEVDLNNYRLTPETQEERVISSKKQYFKNYDGNITDLAYGGFNWSSVIVGSTLKIYTYSIGDGFNLQLFTGGWSMLENISAEDRRIHTSEVEGDEALVIEIELTKELLQQLINNQGLISQGKLCVIVGMTIIDAEVELASGNFSWTGKLDKSNDWNSKFTELASTAYDWTNVKSGSKLTFEFTSSSGQPQIQIRLAKNDQQVPGISDYAPWMNNLPGNEVYGAKKTITLNDTMLNAIRANGGIVFAGGSYVLTKVELTMAN